MSTHSQLREEALTPLRKQHEKMREIHQRIVRILEHEQTRQVLRRNGSKDLFLDMIFIAFINGSENRLVIFAERDDDNAMPRFGILNWKKQVVIPVDGVAVSGNLEDMQAVYETLFEKINGFHKETDFPLVILPKWQLLNLV